MSAGKRARVIMSDSESSDGPDAAPTHGSGSRRGRRGRGVGKRTSSAEQFPGDEESSGMSGAVLRNICYIQCTALYLQ
jgi:hypothetical protein